MTVAETIKNTVGLGDGTGMIPSFYRFERHNVVQLSVIGLGLLTLIQLPPGKKCPTPASPSSTVTRVRTS